MINIETATQTDEMTLRELYIGATRDTQVEKHCADRTYA